MTSLVLHVRGRAIAGFLSVLGIGSLVPPLQDAYAIGGIALYATSTITWLIGASAFRIWPLFERRYGYFMPFVFGFTSFAGFLFKVSFEVAALDRQITAEASSIALAAFAARKKTAKLRHAN